MSINGWKEGESSPGKTQHAIVLAWKYQEHKLQPWLIVVVWYIVKLLPINSKNERVYL